MKPRLHRLPMRRNAGFTALARWMEINASTSRTVDLGS